MNLWMRRTAGLGALLSMLLIALSMFLSTGLSEDTAEFLILLAPLALLPAVLALHRLYRRSAPRANFLVATAGILGCLALPVLLVISVAAALPQPQPLLARQIFALNIPVWLLSYALWTVGLGIWLLWPGRHALL